MDKGLVIKIIGQKKLDNPMHVRYHSEMYTILKSVDQAKNGIPAAVMTEYDEGISKEVAIGLEAQSSPLSKQINQADKDRDRLVQYLFGFVRNARLAPEPATVEAAEELMPVVTTYAKLPNEAVDRETAHIMGLLDDLKKPALTAHLATLGLSALPTKIEAANKKFADLYLKRSDERAASKLPLASEVRPKTDAAFERIVQTLQWNYLFGQSPIEKVELEKLADRLNQRGAELNAAFNRSLGQKASDEKNKDPKQPKPKKPKDDDKPDIHLPEEEDPKKPEGGGESGTGGGPEIHMPEE